MILFFLTLEKLYKNKKDDKKSIINEKHGKTINDDLWKDENKDDDSF